MGFSQDIAAFAKKTKQSKERTAVAVLFKLNELVVMRTPVRTGRARGGTVASVDTLPTGTGGPDKSGGKTLSRLNGVAAMAVGHVYYLANNVRYIAVLEYGGYLVEESEKTIGGYSRQAPQGMFRISIQELQEFIRGYKP